MTKIFRGSRTLWPRRQTLRNCGPETGAWENSVATQTRKHCELDSKLRTKVNYEKFVKKSFFPVCDARKSLTDLEMHVRVLVDAVAIGAAI